ncbi:unnamed protein product [Notodromas monacha]|uniref:Intraflagellar transport protein 22 homolog n=1 Tax=Notodromas monacha TaxID=399045 RepID=A0A7R9BQS7_9CRUS|nr:unnamed protein product [Notodromas monacha]CAG0918463.1 unnamed protein product [Notodromas monacha]
MQKLKIVVAGPKKGGKTVLANILAEASENPIGAYRPTKGVRIIEFEGTASGSSSSGLPLNVKVDVEMWDCSGDASFENCWPVIQDGANGVLFVYRSGNASDAKEMDSFYSSFVAQRGIKDRNCMVFANIFDKDQETRGKLSSTFSRIPQIDVNLQHDADSATTEFQRFLGSVLEGVKERQDKAEISMIRN